MDITKANPRYGISDWNELYQCDTCCFCARILTVTLAQRQQRHNIEKFAPHQNTEWQSDIDRRILDKSSQPSLAVLNLGFRQRIHASCNSVMTREEADQLVAHAKDRIYIPADENDCSVNINLDYGAIARSSGPAPLCDYCDAALWEQRRGLFYLNPQRQRKYLHFACYEKLRDMRITAYQEQEAEEKRLKKMAKQKAVPVLTY